MFEEPSQFKKLVFKMKNIKEKPMFVKIPPYLNEKEREDRLELVDIGLKAGMEGITAINTVKVREPRLSTGYGGLSGKKIFKEMIKIVREIHLETNGKAIINACGGIFTGLDALEAFKAGATTIQLLTSFIYEGPGVINRINKQLLKLMHKHGYESLSEIKN